ncbi:MAG: hypothetical protein ACLPN1_14990 [Dissulfurispiraceae bacterium]
MAGESLIEFARLKLLVVDKMQIINYNVIMIVFEWNENKNTVNKKKHHIPFEEARTVFVDEVIRIILRARQSPWSRRPIGGGE